MYTYKQRPPFAPETILGHFSSARDIALGVGAVRVIAAVGAEDAKRSAVADAVRTDSPEWVMGAYRFLRGLGEAVIHHTKKVYVNQALTQDLAFNWGVWQGGQALGGALGSMAKSGEQRITEALSGYAAHLITSGAAAYRPSDYEKVKAEAERVRDNTTQQGLIVTNAIGQLYDTIHTAAISQVAIETRSNLQQRSYEDGKRVYADTAGPSPERTSFTQNVLEGHILEAPKHLWAIAKGGMEARPPALYASRRDAYERGVYSALAFSVVALEKA